MQESELIARQALRIAELEEENGNLRAAISDAVLKIICIGGPLNDNKLRYTRDQLREWHQVFKSLDIE